MVFFSAYAGMAFKYRPYPTPAKIQVRIPSVIEHIDYYFMLLS